MLTIFLHLDPFVPFQKMVQHRIREYAVLQQRFEGHGSRVYWLAAGEVIRTERNFLIYELSKLKLKAKVIPVDLPANSNAKDDLYCATAQAGYLPDDVQEKYGSIYDNVGLKPDIIITNTPSLNIRRRWRDSLIVHFELGIFQRDTFSDLITLDPLGYSYRSLISLAGNSPRRLRTKLLTRVNTERVNRIKAFIDSHANTERKLSGVFLPLTSGRTWISRLESYAGDPINEVLQARKAFPNDKIFVAEKPQHKLTEEVKVEIRSLGIDIELLAVNGEDGIGNWGVARFSKIFTSSSSLALQALYWGAHTKVPKEHPLFSWTLLDDKSLMDSFSIIFGLTQFNKRTDDPTKILETLTSVSKDLDL
jgi:hypothetical protein